MTIKTKIAVITLTAITLFSCTSCGNRTNAENNESTTTITETSAQFKVEEITPPVSTANVETTTTASVTKKLSTSLVLEESSNTTTETTSVKLESPNTNYNISEKNNPINEVNISIDMDISVPTEMSKEDFKYAMDNLPYDYTGYYSRNSEIIWTLCHEKGLNEIVACGIIAQESGWAKVAGWGQNNYFGISGGKYSTEEEGLNAFISLLTEKYLSEDGAYYKGKTLKDVGATYCDANAWPQSVYGCMKLIVSY